MDATMLRELPDEARLWQAVLQRDQTYDRLVVFAVRSTGVYCRPSCPARRPHRQQVRFYDSPAAAERDGFRACKRCAPGDAYPLSAASVAIERACAYIAANLDQRLTLSVLSREVGLSAAHFQRQFLALKGVSPAKFVKACRTERLKAALRDGQTVTSALYASGYQSSNGLYRDAQWALGMTPATYGRRGRGATIRYGIAACALGYVLLAATERGVCGVRLGDDPDDLAAGLANEYAEARLERDDDGLHDWLQVVIQRIAVQLPAPELPLDIAGTPFQRQVWQALQAIRPGETRSYGALAERIGSPAAVRAVGQACGANPVAVIIPCHRAVRANGDLGGYRWGLARKRTLLASERAAHERSSSRLAD